MSIITRKHPKVYLLIVILGVLSLVVGACTQSPKQSLPATPLEVPQEAIPDEYINVIIQVSSTQACKLILSTPHKTEVDNYLSPYTIDTLTIPNSDGTVVFHERIPADTTPGNYILKVMQLKRDGDTEGTEIYSQTFIIRQSMGSR
jgi:hypothetical protein